MLSVNLILMIFEILHTVAGYIIASCHVHVLGSLFHLSSLPRHIGFSFVTIFVKINSFLCHVTHLFTFVDLEFRGVAKPCTAQTNWLF